ESVMASGGEPRHAGYRGLHLDLAEPSHEIGPVLPIRIAERVKTLGRDAALGQGSSIVGNLAKEQLALPWHAVAMRVKLDVGNERIQSGELIRAHQGDRSTLQKVYPVEARSRREHAQPLVFLVRRPSLALRRLADPGR